MALTLSLCRLWQTLGTAAALPNGHDNLRRLSEAKTPSGSSCCYAPRLEVPRTSCQLACLRFRLLEPERHVHVPVHHGRGDEVFAGLLALARASVELAEAEVAVGDERPHAARLGERQRLAVMSVAA